MKIPKLVALHIQITFLLCGCNSTDNRKHNECDDAANSNANLLSDGGNFEKACEIYEEILSWNATELEMYFDAEKAIEENFMIGGETPGVIDELQAQLFDIGYEVRWNKANRKLLLVRSKSKSKENPFRNPIVINEFEAKN